MATSIFVMCYMIYQMRLTGAIESTESAVYDQRQSGHYNIHINIKDVAIFDLEGNDFADKKPGLEDYYYDDDDFTIKPLGSYLTPKPTSKPTTDSSSTLSTSTQELLPSQNFTNSVTVESSTSPGIPPKWNESSSHNVLQQYADEVPKPMPPKNPSVMILNTAPKPIRPTAFPTHMGGLIPVTVISDLEEPHNRRSVPRHQAWLEGETRSYTSGRSEESLNYPVYRCRHRGQIMDSRGNCRIRRSSLLGKIFNMIKSLNPSETYITG